MIENNYYEFIELGDFELTASTMRVSDPCYDRAVHCSGVISRCKRGTWNAGVLKVESFGHRCAALIVRHEQTSFVMDEIRNGTALKAAIDLCDELPTTLGVDSGQLGFFDDAFYQDVSVFNGEDTPKFESDDQWYAYVCDITLSRIGAGVIPYGAVSSSGYGDGGYPCYTHADKNGEVDFAFVVFIDE